LASIQENEKNSKKLKPLDKLSIIKRNKFLVSKTPLSQMPPVREKAHSKIAPMPKNSTLNLKFTGITPKQSSNNLISSLN